MPTPSSPASSASSDQGPDALGRGIDHVAVVVNDLSAAAARFEALGFTTTPRAYHPWGTANHLVQFGRSFIEIVGIADADKLIPHSAGAFSFSAHARDYLAERQGMAMLVLSSRDAEADAKAWQAAGLATYEPVYFERQATLPSGEQVKVAFTVAFTTDERLPACAFFVCQQFFPEHFWKPHYQQHANGARNIGAAILGVHEEPAQYRDFLEAYTGGASVSMDNGVSAALACGRVEVVSRESAVAQFPLLADASTTAPAGHFAQLVIEVDSTDAVAAHLRAQDIPFRQSGADVDISPDDLFGLGLRFSAQ